MASLRDINQKQLTAVTSVLTGARTVLLQLGFCQVWVFPLPPLFSGVCDLAMESQCRLRLHQLGSCRTWNGRFVWALVSDLFVSSEQGKLLVLQERAERRQRFQTSLGA